MSRDAEKPAPAKVASLTIVQRAILAVLMKHKEAGMLYDDVVTAVIKLGLSRRRRRSQFIQTNVWSAVSQLEAAKLVASRTQTFKARPGDEGAYPVGQGMRNAPPYTWELTARVVKITFDGWAVAAQKNLEKLCR